MKIGVVLEGGACLCAFQAGALVELDRQGIRFSHVTGVSAGALNGCAVVSGQIYELSDMWRDLEGTRVVNLKHLTWNWSPFNMSRVTFEIIQKNFNMKEIMSSKIDFAVVTMSLPKFERRVYTNRQKIDMVAALRASNLIPILHSRPVFFNGAFHIDGGFIDNVPVDVPLENGCDRVLVIVNNHRGYLYPKPFFPFPKRVSLLEKSLIVLHPLRRLPLWPFDFRVDRLELAMKMGCEAAQQLLRRKVLE